MSTASKKIMIAYADRSRVFDLGQKCRGLGLEVVGVHNADTALWFLKNERPDLVGMDAEMRTADGVSLCEKIAADGELAFVPVVVMQDAAADDAVRRHRDDQTAARHHTATLPAIWGWKR